MESISRAIGVAAMLGTGITLVLAVVLFLWPVQIMDLLSNKHELSVLGAPYLKLIGFSYVFNMLSSIYVSAMRSAENPGFGMKLFGVSTLLNTGMNYLLIFGNAACRPWASRARPSPRCCPGWRSFSSAWCAPCAAAFCPWTWPPSSGRDGRCCGGS